MSILNKYCTARFAHSYIKCGRQDVCQSAMLCPQYPSTGRSKLAATRLVGVGAVVLQVQHGQLVMIEAASMKFSPKERCDPVIEQEALAIPFALTSGDTLSSERASHYRRISIPEHGQPLTRTVLGHWALCLAGFDKFEHVSGRKNEDADCLSRASCWGLTQFLVASSMP